MSISDKYEKAIDYMPLVCKRICDAGKGDAPTDFC